MFLVDELKVYLEIVIKEGHEAILYVIFFCILLLGKVSAPEAKIFKERQIVYHDLESITVLALSIQIIQTIGYNSPLKMACKS